MKHLRFLSIILFAILAVGCSKSEPEKKAIDITGEWNLTGVATKSASIDGTTVDVYISFLTDKTFTMYQMLGAGRYESFEGTWTLAEDQLSGTYSDGSKWASVYTVAVNGSTMTMTPSGSTEVYTYTKKAIPDDIK